MKFSELLTTEQAAAFSRLGQDFDARCASVIEEAVNLDYHRRATAKITEAIRLPMASRDAIIAATTTAADAELVKYPLPKEPNVQV